MLSDKRIYSISVLGKQGNVLKMLFVLQMRSLPGILCSFLSASLLKALLTLTLGLASLAVEAERLALWRCFSL